jgi:MFS family permease
MGEFGKLWAAGTISGIGDGVALAAVPLLATSLTTDPVAVAGLMVAEQLPFVLFSLPSGALVDRVSRRRLMAVCGVLRAVALGGLGLAAALGHAGLPLLYVVGVLAGCAGVAFENAATTVVPEAAGAMPLSRANGRMLATRTLGQSLLGPPLGAWLFAVAVWTPFVLDAWAFVLVAGLCLALSVGHAASASGRPASLRVAIAEGLRWLLRHRLLRTLAITVAMSNLGLGATLSILVLVARQRLGLDPVGYGVLLTATAVGGIAGGLVADRVATAVGPGTVLRFGLLVEALAHAGMALTRDAVLAGAILAVLGLELLVFSTINMSVRQSVAPRELLGRVHSAYRLVSNGGLLLGAVLGGLLARAFGLTTPLWVGAVAAAVAAAAVWRVLTDREVGAALARPPAEPSPRRR